MMHDSDYVASIITKTNWWECCPDGFKAHLLDKTSIFLSDAELDAYDKRLSTYLRISSSHGFWAGTGKSVHGVMASQVDPTLEYWSRQHFKLTDINGESFIVKGMYSMKLLPNLEQYFIKVMVYAVESWPVPVKSEQLRIEEVPRFDDLILIVDRKWLDESYPQWEQRWDTCVALDIPPLERPAYFFQTLPISSMNSTLPDNFDQR